MPKGCFSQKEYRRPFRAESQRNFYSTSLVLQWVVAVVVVILYAGSFDPFRDHELKGNGDLAEWRAHGHIIAQRGAFPDRFRVDLSRKWQIFVAAARSQRH